MVVLDGWEFFRPFQFPGKVLRLVDQDRETLRADKKRFFPVMNVNHRYFIFGTFTIKALFFHRVPLYIPPSTVSITPVT